MNMHCRCGPRLRYAADSRPHSRVGLSDAGTNVGIDPTGTMPLQSRFKKDLDARWAKLRRMVPSIVVARTDLATTIAHAAATGQDTVRAFQKWFDSALKMVVVGDGRWMARYVREAGDAALMRSSALTRAQASDAGPDDEARDDHGRWTSGGAGTFEHNGVLKLISPKEDMTKTLSPNATGWLHKWYWNNSPGEDIKAVDVKNVTPSDDVIKEVSKFVPKGNVRAYRAEYTDAIGSGNEDKTKPMESWSKYLQPPALITEGSERPMRVVSKLLDPSEIVIDTSKLPKKFRDANDDPQQNEIVVARGVFLDHLRAVRGTKPQKNFDPGFTEINSSHLDPFEKNMGLGTKKVKDAALTPPDRVPPLQTLAHTELQGIAEATSQQAVRAYATGLLNQSTPAQIARDVQAIVDKVGIARSRMLASFIVVRTFSAVTLDSFRAAGLTHVGTVAERTGSRPPNGGPVRDAVFPSRKITRAENKLKRTFGEGDVDVLTAGDNDVCEECQDISDEGPYSLDDAEDLIPAHPNCRCSFVPADDNRFASVHEDDLGDSAPSIVWDMNPNHDEKGRFSTGESGPSEDSVTVYHGTGTQFLPSILKNGLRKSRAPDASRSGVYVSTSRNEAMHFARQNVAKNETTGKYTKPVVLELKVPRRLVESAKVDQIARSVGQKKSIILNSKIPKQWIIRGTVHGVHDSTTHIAAGVMIMDPQGRALFLKRSTNGDHAGEWAFPAGAVEPGETPQGAAAREVQEEINFTPTDLEQIDRRELDGVDFTTFGTMVTGMFAPALDHEHTDWTWRLLTDPPEPLHPGVRATVNHAVLGDAFDPNEPRDQTGKWTAGGGGGGPDEHIDKLKSVLQSADIQHTVVPSKLGGHYVYVAPHDASSLNALAMAHSIPAYNQGVSDKDENLMVFHIPEKEAPPEPHSAFDPPGPLDMKDLTKVSGKMGSNEGGVYKHADASMHDQYYVKQPASPDHVQNELIAAKLYQLAGVHTLNYVPVKGGEHVATELETLQKNNVSQLDPAERDAAKSDFAVHAWLANWDAVGTGGDNVGLRKDGSVVTLDTGGSLKYRAQGEPKGAAFSNTVDEINTLRDPSKSPDAAKLYGDMTNEQITASINRVKAIPDGDIVKAVIKNGGTMSLANQLIARKDDLASQAAKMSTSSQLVSPDKPMPTFGKAPVPEPTAFKTKMEHAKHLLMKGTTSQELKTALNWPAIGVPATAASLGLKLEKTKLPGGAFHYKGTQMSPEELKAAKAEGKATTQEVPAPTTIVGKNDVTFGKAASPATQAELDKAKKNATLLLQHVPGAPQNHPEAQALVDKFNAKYAGQTIHTPEALQNKVSDFKALQAAMVPLASAQQKAEATAKANLQSSAAAKKEAAAKAEADKLANLHTLPEEEQRQYWFKKAIGGPHYYQQAQDDLASKSKGPKLEKMGVTASEVAFIKAFTGSHSGVNAELIKGSMSEEQLAYKGIMNEALDKMNKYDGPEVYRKISLTPEQQNEYTIGNIKHWTNFSSTSKDKATWSGNTHFTIKNPKTGVDVQFISVNAGEKEVIMPADTYYKVLSKTKNQDVYGNTNHGITHIVLEEVVPTFGKKKKAA